MATDTLAPPSVCPKAPSQGRMFSGAGCEVAASETAIPFPCADVNQKLIIDPMSSHEEQCMDMLAALRQTLRAKWFWYAAVSSLCWTGWAFTAKIGSREIPPANMQFISAFGFLLITLLALPGSKAKTSNNRLGKAYALMSGLLLAFGGICLYGAYRSGDNASIITAVTSLYPMITVACATAFLRERLNWMQVMGLFFATAAIVILSI